MKLPFVRITIDRFNPNHKYRFYVVAPPFGFHWLMTVWFTNKDQSIYIKPHFRDRYTVHLAKDEGTTDYECEPEGDYHLSLHKSGVVNFTFVDKKERLREPIKQRAPARKVLTMAINRYDRLQPASVEEINAPRGQHKYLPIVGISPRSPIWLTIYCVDNDCEWNVPALGNTVQLHYETKLKEKNYSYHFVVWQDTNLPMQAGDLAISWKHEPD
jgi:hypothetical protein